MSTRQLRGTTRGPVFDADTGGGDGVCGGVDNWPIYMNDDGTLASVPFLRTVEGEHLADSKGDLLYAQDPMNIQAAFANTIQWVADSFSVASYGAMALSAPVGPDLLGITWIVMDEYDTIDVPVNGVTLNTGTGEFSFLHKGVWQVAFGVNFTHDESNSGRETNVRLFNVTEATATAPVPIGIGRNQPATNVNFSLLVDIGATDVGDLYRVEMGGGDTITIVQWEAIGLDLNMESEWREALIDPTG